jgi:hypothetical protein
VRLSHDVASIFLSNTRILVDGTGLGGVGFANFSRVNHFRDNAQLGERQ